MRIRRKKWARPELEVCPYYYEDPELKGKWETVFPVKRTTYLEVGCGKGIFAAKHAVMYPDVNIIAADIKADMLGVARRTVEKEFEAAGREHDNIVLTRMNVSHISEHFDISDNIERIYINFCNPWNRGKHNKRRLTHPRQLEQYKQILRPGGEIRFKTDDDILFEDSLEYFAETGFKTLYLTRDLHAENFPDNIMTEHEKMFSDEGIKIKYIAVSQEMK
ncbi:MAG: tRNA (guanosine(46)-N7)-methyltransferase TrmB [Oscillospiraceae bacterium]|nr:tRNA (guanosine(46)-N7)-methyltransferase TrmB [Oscillospiraceae bacterium]